MKKLLCLLGVIVFLFISCSGDDENSGNQSNDILPVKIIQYFEDGTSNTATIQYDGKKLKKVLYEPGNTVIEYAYSGNLITEIKYITNGSLERTEYFQYDSESRLSRYKEVEEDDDYNSEVNYSYNSDGTITFMEFTGVSPNQPMPISSGTIVLNGLGQVEAILHENHHFNVYTYDDKNSPFKNIEGFNKLFFMDKHATAYKQNFIKEEDPYSMATTTYTYNSSFYPVVAVEDDGSGIIKKHYFYND